MSNATRTQPDRSLLQMLPLAVLLAALPQLGELAMPVTALATLLGLWQLYLTRKGRNRVGRPLQLLILLSCFATLLLSYGNIIGRQAGVALLILMSLLKLFETRSPRDCYIIICSCLFILASSFFQSQTIWQMLYVFALVIFLFAILIALSDRLHSLSLHQRLKLALRFNLLALPLMLVLFLLFPRIPGPLWGLPEDAFTASTGLGEDMAPGSINRLIRSSATAFRVKFHGPVPPPAERYWRGVVLSQYDGHRWRRDDAPDSAEAFIDYDQQQPRIYDYTLTLEATGFNWLLSLETVDARRLPATGPVQDRPRLNREAVLLRKEKVSHAISYRLRSQGNARNRGLFPRESHKNRLLPVGRNPQTLQLAKRLMRESGYRLDDYIRLVLQYFRQQGFVYTLQPDLLGEHAMDDFLLRTRRGFCEHYASAFAMLMRAAGVPARVVIGYQGGHMNPLDKYMIVRQSDAHAWVEIWYGNSDNGYWRRIDPTAAVSPERIEQGVANAGLENEELPLLLTSQSGLLKNLAWLYDSLQHSWNRWIIGFDQSRQQAMLSSLLSFLGLDQSLGGRRGNLILLLVISLGLASLLTAWLLLRPRPDSSDRVQAAYLRLCRRLARRGLARAPGEGPQDYENRLLRDLELSPGERGRLQLLFKAYRRLHYGNIDNPRLQKLFVRQARKF